MWIWESWPHTILFSLRESCDRNAYFVLSLECLRNAWTDNSISSFANAMQTVPKTKFQRNALKRCYRKYSVCVFEFCEISGMWSLIAYNELMIHLYSLWNWYFQNRRWQKHESVFAMSKTETVEWLIYEIGWCERCERTGNYLFRFKLSVNPKYELRILGIAVLSCGSRSTILGLGDKLNAKCGTQQLSNTDITIQ